MKNILTLILYTVSIVAIYAMTKEELTTIVVGSISLIIIDGVIIKQIRKIK